jgi:hypothetical protein
MGSLLTAFMVFIASFTTGICGVFLRGRHPEGSLDDATSDVVKLVMGLIATMAAIILGMLIAGANASYNQQSDELEGLATNVVLLDKMLEAFGAQADPVRGRLKTAMEQAHARLWTPNGLNTVNFQAAQIILREVQALEPKTPIQRALQERVLRLSEDVMRTRLLNTAQSSNGGISRTFLSVLIFWNCALFFGFGLFGRANRTTLATLLVGSASVGAAIFLILDLNQPYQGFMQLSDAPLKMALQHIGP